ncbi:MAG: hypothetical protein VB144_03495 [Clostridia bacterium]|nr:hypothetical protein [Clostridia bacterium]
MGATNNAGRKRGMPAAATILIIAVAALGVWAIARSRMGGPAALLFTPPWSEGEVSTLEIRKDGVVLGQWEMRVEARGIETALVSVMKAEASEETAAVIVNPATLVPSRTEFEEKSAQGQATYIAEYGPSDVVISAQTPNGPQEARMKLPKPPYFDNEQMVMVLRALPLAMGFKATLNDIITRAASKDTVEVEVVKKETVDVSAGSFEAWAVQFRGTGQTAWIAVDPQRQLVKYENTRAGTVSELTKYSGGQRQ